MGKLKMNGIDSAVISLPIYHLTFDHHLIRALLIAQNEKIFQFDNFNVLHFICKSKHRLSKQN